jgi:hypothetical protein
MKIGDTVRANIATAQPWAEIRPGIDPTWHCLRTLPGLYGVAISQLADRRVGVYAPIEDRWDRDKLAGQKPLFPGYLFCFLWGLAEHAELIRDCRGVAGFLCDQNGAPIVVSDSLIAEVRDIEWTVYLSHMPRSFFRPRRGRPVMVRRWVTPNRGFADPNPDNRISALRKALGLA